jgi:hypothetical protein
MTPLSPAAEMIGTAVALVGLTFATIICYPVIVAFLNRRTRK